jgi:hypothetical protein
MDTAAAAITNAGASRLLDLDAVVSAGVSGLDQLYRLREPGLRWQFEVLRSPQAHQIAEDEIEKSLSVMWRPRPARKLPGAGRTCRPRRSGRCRS